MSNIIMKIAFILLGILVAIVDGGYLGWLFSRGSPTGTIIGMVIIGTVMAYAWIRVFK